MKALAYRLEKKEGENWIGHYAEVRGEEVKEKPKWKAVLKGNISPKWKEGDLVFVLGEVDYGKRPVEVEVELDIKKLYLDLVKRWEELSGKEADMDEGDILVEVNRFGAELSRIYKKGDRIALFIEVKDRLLSLLTEEQREWIEKKCCRYDFERVKEAVSFLRKKGYRIGLLSLGIWEADGDDYVVVFPPDFEGDIEERRKKKEEILKRLKEMPYKHSSPNPFPKYWNRGNGEAVYLLKGVNEKGEWITELISEIDWDTANRKGTRAKLIVCEECIENGDIVVVKIAPLQKEIYRKDGDRYGYLTTVSSLSELKGVAR